MPPYFFVSNLANTTWYPIAVGKICTNKLPGITIFAVIFEDGTVTLSRNQFSYNRISVTKTLNNLTKRILNLLLIVSSLFGYLEWGAGNKSFLFQAEIELLPSLFTDATSFFHPFVLVPLSGQILLLITIFQKTPGHTLTFTGIAFLSLLLGFMLFIGILGWHMKIILSTIPFISIAIFTIWYYRKQINATGAKCSNLR